MPVRHLIALIVFLLLAMPPAFPQEATSPSRIEVSVLAGDGASNSIEMETAVAPRVRVVDGAGQPVAGAEVVFETPGDGASATFYELMRIQTVHTDADGIAQAIEYAPNQTAGQFQVSVTAKAGEAQTSAALTQTNVASPVKKNNKKLYVLIGVIGAVVALVALAYGHDTN